VDERDYRVLASGTMSTVNLSIEVRQLDSRFLDPESPVDSSSLFVVPVGLAGGSRGPVGT
jgi:hypothetical protein